MPREPRDMIAGAHSASAGPTKEGVYKAVDKLAEKRYPNFSDADENAAIAGIKAFSKRIDEFKRTSGEDINGLSELKCGAAKRFIDRIDTVSKGYNRAPMNISEQIAIGGRTARRVFALVWHAMHDPAVMQAEVIQQAERQFICQMYEIQRAYNIEEEAQEAKFEAASSPKVDPDKPSCDGGSYTRFVLALNNIHPDVQVSFVTRASLDRKLTFLICQSLQKYCDALSEQERRVFLQKLEAKDEYDRLQFAQGLIPNFLETVQMAATDEFGDHRVEGITIAEAVNESFLNDKMPWVPDSFFDPYKFTDALNELRAEVASKQQSDPQNMLLPLANEMATHLGKVRIGASNQDLPLLTEALQKTKAVLGDSSPENITAYGDMTGRLLERYPIEKKTNRQRSRSCGQIVASLALGIFGACLIGASIYLGVVTFAGATPLTVMGVKLGLGMISAAAAGVAVGSTALVGIILGVAGVAVAAQNPGVDVIKTPHHNPSPVGTSAVNFLKEARQPVAASAGQEAEPPRLEKTQRRQSR